MIVKSLHVQNFRCIKDETLFCDNLSVLVGPNGSGKSAFLRALQMFYEPAAKYEAEDFYAGNTSEPLLVTVTYRDLTSRERELFRKYIEQDELVVQKEMKWSAGRTNQKYYGMSLQNREFEDFRAAGKATERRAAYSALRQSDEYSALPSWTTQDAGAQALKDWEEANADRCERNRDEGQFFGFKEVGEARLEQNTRFLYVPAVLEASEEAAERKGAALSELLDLVVRSVLAQREDVKEFQAETQKRYDEVMDPDKMPELKELANALDATLKTYAPDAAVELPWRPGGVIEIPLPRADPRLVEDQYATAVQRAGHGLQRAFLLALLQHLAIAEAPATEAEDETSNSQLEPIRPDLILGIEEPELYQHPNRQRHLSSILLKLANGSIGGVAKRTQVIYTTHSPLFVGIDRTDQVRLLRKVPGENGDPKHTKVSQTSLDEVARVIERADGKPAGTYSGATMGARLVALMTPWVNEGFFARVAVLVEGEQDRAAILGIAGRSGHDLESMGISVIPCNGKTKLDRPAAIFRGLDIAVYVIWDSDYGKRDPKPEVNRRLLRLFGESPEDWPERVSSNYACFKRDLDTTLRSEIGSDLFGDLVQKTKAYYEFDKDEQTLKSPQAVRAIMEDAYAEGRSSSTLNQIVSSIVALLR